ncbi:MAG: DNA translocase FtsK 4TM domain-containing protein [Planctomycetota bacterium]|nr:DNA translocase FtsK 4TM domain-containing protein [Planctomycetota bacterium]
MTRKAKPARAAGAESAAGGPVGSVPVRRVGWVVLAGVWLFLVVALGSFHAADWPSHVVAVHNEPVANLCGVAGALIAYWSYQVIGVGSWVILAGLLGYLIVTAAGRRVTHPLVRIIGLLLMALAVSGGHGLLFPTAGPLAGSHAGLLATAIVGELVPRFSTVGSLLLLLAGLAVGAVVAADRLVLALPRILWRAVRALRGAARRPRGVSLRRLFGRPKPALAPDAAADAHDEAEEDGYDDEYVYEDEEEGEEEPEAEEPEVIEPAEEVRPRLSARELREKIARLPIRMAGGRKTVARDEDIPREASFEGYEFPTLDLLEDPESNFSEKMESFVRKQAQQLEETLQTYGIDGEVVGIESGPAITLYSVQLVPGTKVAKISAVSKDIARSLRAHNIRIVPNMAGKTTIGIEVPNLKREQVRLKELMSGGHAEGMVLPMYLGKDASGESLVADLTRMPHMLIAGTTGSGKSVCMNSIIMSWLYTKRPDELKLVLVDPKMVEMSQFADIPHLMCPVVTEATRAAAIMEWAVERMEERYELFKEARVRDIASYNRLGEEELCERMEAETDEEKARIPRRLPYFVFMVDELADMMMAHKEVEHAIVRIAQKARAVGIHLILATQRPQANVVTGLIKSNMPCRVSFKVSSGMDSRIVLDQKGAELLLGQGDMMFLTPHTTDVKRAQGTLVEDGEIRAVVKFLKRVAGPSFERSLIAIRPDGDETEAGLGEQERDPLFDEAVKIIIESGRGSVSLLQRRLSIGYGRASRLVDQMSLAGIVGDHKGSVAREVLITLEEWEQMKRLMEEEGEESEDVLFEGEPADEADEPPGIEMPDESDDASLPAR